MEKRFIDEVKDVIGTSLPASSEIVAKLMHVIYSQSANAKIVADTIEHDPSLSANILKIANSAFYGSSSKINSLQRAVVILGFDTLKEIISTLSTINCFQNKDGSDREILTDFWYHSVGTAKACQLISNKMFLDRPDVAYVVGLLHDIGKILMLIYFPDKYREVLKLTKEKNTRIILAENRLLHTDHTTIGKMLCSAWSLPEDVCFAISNHHDPIGENKSSQRLARIVELGDYICRIAEIGFAGDTIIKEPSPATMALLGRTKEAIEENYTEILKQLIESKSEIENYFIEHESD